MFDFGFSLSRIVALSDAFCIVEFLWLVTGLSGLLATVFAFINWEKKNCLNWVKAAAIAKKKAWKKLNVPWVQHIWIKDYGCGEQPSTCCVCLTSLLFLQNLGTKAVLHAPIHRRAVCGVGAHFCSPYAAKDCKCFAQAGQSHGGIIGQKDGSRRMIIRTYLHLAFTAMSLVVFLCLMLLLHGTACGASALFMSHVMLRCPKKLVMFVIWVPTETLFFLHFV